MTPTRILVTGMSGTGKSTVLAALARRGHRVVDTDEGDWSEDVWLADRPALERLWREDRMTALLSEAGDDPMFVAGCVSNQGRFYDRFEAVVLLSAPTDVLLGRLASRTTNRFGKHRGELERILTDLARVEPLLRLSATVEIRTDRALDDVVAAVESLAGVSGRSDRSSPSR